MTDIKVDAITSLMPLGSRTIVPATAFAAHLDQAWCCTTATAMRPASPGSTRVSGSTRDSAPRSSPTRDETAHATTGRLERDRTKQDDHTKDPAEDGALAGCAPDPPYPQDESRSSPDAVTAEEPSVNAATEGDGAQSQSTDENADARASGQHQEDSATDATGQTENEAASASSETADAAATKQAANVQAMDATATDGEASAALNNGSEMTADSTQSTANAEAETAMEIPTVNEASSETASENDADGRQEKSDADTPKASTLQDGTSVGETKPDGESQPELGSEAHHSRTRHEGPIAGREPDPMPENQANGQAEAQTINAPAQPTANPNSAAAAVAAASAVVETRSPTSPATNADTGPVESIDGITTETTNSTSATRGSGSNAPTSEVNPADGVDRARFVQRVARAFQAAGDKGGTIRLRLSPPELGSLHAEITVRQGVMNARVETETEAARQLLLENLPALQDRLAEQGIKVEQFQVDVADRQTGESPGQAEPHANSDGSDTSEGNARRRSSHRNPTNEDTESSNDRRTRRADELGRLDVLV